LREHPDNRTRSPADCIRAAGSVGELLAVVTGTRAYHHHVTDAETTRTPTAPSTGAPPPTGASSTGTPTEAPTPGDVQASGGPVGALPPPRTEPPSSTWRPPASDSGRNVSLILGAIVLIVGLWFFATRTLGLDLPEIDWGQFWPVILIVLGAWIVLNAMRQRAR